MRINQKLNDFKESIKNKLVAVIGMGVSNTPLIRYLLDLDANITVFDKKTEEELNPSLCEEYAMQGVKFSLGENYLDNLNGYDVIFRSPSMRPDHIALAREVERGAILTSEIEMLIQLCPCKVIGITGSDGKTTTTTLIYKILEEDGYHCFLGGNIGTPLFAQIDEIKEDDIVVLELSSFQLMTLKVSPEIAVVTNVSPNHLDIHKDYEEYILAKENIFINQDKNDIVILNFNNDVTYDMTELAKGSVRYFSTKNEVPNGAFVDNGEIVVKAEDGITHIMPTSDILLMGAHNIENACTAVAAIYDLVKVESIVNVLKTFKGVEHRNEFVRNINGVKWYNDSIGSSPTRTIAGLLSFDQKVILIAGGYDKHLDYGELGKYIVDHVSNLILLGQTKDKIRSAVMAEISHRDENISLRIIECGSLEETVETAHKIAKDGDIVFFSPASASFDMFKNFMERGDKFKNLVNNLT